MTLVHVKDATPESDGNFKDYFLQVPPTVTTAEETVAWSFGMTVKEYRKLRRES